MSAPAVATPPKPALCPGGECFVDEAAVLADARDRKLTVRRKLGAYRCPRCEGWRLERRRWLR